MVLTLFAGLRIGETVALDVDDVTVSTRKGLVVIRSDLTSPRCRAFTMWLGLRYDRPALQPELAPLARRIAEELRRRPGRPVVVRVLDVLMPFDEAIDEVGQQLAADRGVLCEFASWPVLIGTWAQVKSLARAVDSSF